MNKKITIKNIKFHSIGENNIQVIFCDDFLYVYRKHFALSSAYADKTDEEIRNMLNGVHGRVELLQSDDGSTLVMVFDNNPSDRLISHEAMHAAHFFLDLMGVHNLTTDTQELFAYTLDFIFSQVQKLRDDLKKKNAIAHKKYFQKKAKKLDK